MKKRRVVTFLGLSSVLKMVQSQNLLVTFLGLSSVLNMVQSQNLLDFLNNEIIDNFGLTAYGEPCTGKSHARLKSREN